MLHNHDIPLEGTLWRVTRRSTAEKPGLRGLVRREDLWSCVMRGGELGRQMKEVNEGREAWKLKVSCFEIEKREEKYRSQGTGLPAMRSC